MTVPFAGRKVLQVIPGEKSGSERQEDQGGAADPNAALRQFSDQVAVLFFRFRPVNFGFQLIQRVQRNAKDQGTEEQQDGPRVHLPLMVEKGFSGQQVQVPDLLFQLLVIGFFFEAFQQGGHGGAFQRVGLSDLAIVEQQQESNKGAKDG